MVSAALTCGMGDGETSSEIGDGASTAMLRRLRLLIGDGEPEALPGWRDDLRLFALTWAAGFLFFLVVLA